MSLALAFLLGQIIPQCDGHCVMNASYVTNPHSSNVKVHDVSNNVNPDEQEDDIQEAVIVDCQSNQDESTQKTSKKKSQNSAKIVTTSSEKQEDEEDSSIAESDDIKDQESKNEVNQRLAADHANHLAFLIAEDKGLVQRTL